MRGVRFVAFLACLVQAPCLCALRAHAGPSPTELAALVRFGRRVAGFVVWESNCTGAWELYRINTNGTGFRQLTQLAAVSHRMKYTDYLRPRVSPDGKVVLFAYVDTRGKHVESWFVSATGGKARRVTQGVPLNWHADGREFYFVRNHKVWRHVLESGAESIVHDAWVPADGKDGSMVGAVRADLKAGVFRTRRNEYLIFGEGGVAKTTKGCEPSFTADGRFMYWMGAMGQDISMWDMVSGEERVVLHKPPTKPYDYIYFPTVSADNRWLCYGASPGQFDHQSSDYEVFVQEMNGWKLVGRPVRLTWDKRTDRWPYLHVQRLAQRLAKRKEKPPKAPRRPPEGIKVRVITEKITPGDETPPSTPRGLVARADGERVTLSWQPSRDNQSGISYYKVHRSGREIAQVRDGTEYVDTSAEPETMYSYRVSAVNTIGLESEPSLAVVVVTGDSPPSPPKGVRAVAGDGVVRLNWSANREKDLREYSVFRAETPSGAYEPLAKPLKPRFEDSAVENGRVYCYRISAVDRKGNESERSDVVRATPGPRATEGLVALFTFTEGEGDKVRDGSRAEPPIELTIEGRRGIRWLAGRNGVEFTGWGAVAARDAGRVLRALRWTSRITVEAWIEPGNLFQWGPARIVSMSADSGRANFTLGQDRSKVVFRLTTSETTENGIPQLDTARGALAKTLTHVVCTFDGSTKRVYVNGKPRPEEQKLGGDFRRWKSFPLVLGSEATGERPWRGKMFLVAIYDRALGAHDVLRNYRAGCRVPREAFARGASPAASRDEPTPFAGDRPVHATPRRRRPPKGDEPAPFTGE